MNIQQVRNATIIVEYGGKKILIDPMLGKKGCMPPFPFSRNQHLRNPLHELPFPVEEMLKGVDAVLLTHLHDDHIDEAAYEIFVTHLEGVNHNSVTHEMVRKRAKVAGILDRVFIPEDGEMVEDL